jgi:hypothetical protein
MKIQNTSGLVLPENVKATIKNPDNNLVNQGILARVLKLSENSTTEHQKQVIYGEVVEHLSSLGLPLNDKSVNELWDKALTTKR